MKKMILIVLLFLCINVKAETIYSSYSDYSGYELESKEESDLIKKEESNMYRIYNKEIMSKYFIEGENTSDYPYMYIDDFYYTPFSEWTSELVFKPNRIIEDKMIYSYKKMNNIKYILINNINTTLSVMEIRYYYDNNMSYNYNLICNNCDADFNEKVSNKLYNDYSHIYQNGSMLIELDDYYDPAYIGFELFIYDPDGCEKRFTINVSENKDMNPIYIKKDVINNNKDNNIDDVIPSYHFMDYFEMVNPNYSDILVSDSVIYSNISTIVDTSFMYRYQDKLLKYNGIIKTYKEGYYLDSTAEYPFKVPITVYRYKYRHRLVLKDELVINNYEQKLEDFILECTANVDIVSNMNYKINGTYDIIFSFGDKEIKRKVVVDISNNLKNALDYVIKENKELKKLNNDLSISLNNKILDIKEILKEKDEMSADYKNKILQLKQEEGETELIEEDNGFDLKIIFTILFLVGLFLIIRIWRKLYN